MANEEETSESTENQDTPDESVTRAIVVDLGKTKRSRIRKLKRGRGRLVDEVYDVVDDVKASLGKEADGKTFVPVVIVYRRKRKRGKGLFPFPLPLR